MCCETIQVMYNAKQTYCAYLGPKKIFIIMSAKFVNPNLAVIKKHLRDQCDHSSRSLTVVYTLYAYDVFS
jgi:hypothetical protein